MSGSGIDLFLGELTVSPIPLEMSLNYCSTGCHFCSHADTPIMLANLRTIPAGQVKVGDELLGWERGEPSAIKGPAKNAGACKFRKWARTTVTNVFHRKAPVQRIVLANGDSVVCTPDHHWFTGRDKTEYKPVRMWGGNGTKSSYLHKIDVPLLGEQRVGDAYRIGYIRGVCEGDGAWMPQKAWRLALTDSEPLDRVAEYLQALGFARPERRSYYEGNDRHAAADQFYFETGNPVNELINGLDLEDREYWRGWLAGIYDAEGNTPAKLSRTNPEALRIAQYKTANPLTYDRILRVLRIFGFGYVQEERTIRVVGGRLEASRFCQLVQPSIHRKQNPLIGSGFRGMEHPHKVVAVEPIGEAEVASFETTTHNYVAGGYLSRNCFANLGNPNRTADVEGILRAIATKDTRRGLDAVLMSCGCPIVVSNRVDPFATSNVNVALPIMRTMTEVGIPYAVQTRGGKGIDEFLSFATPSVWYISVCSLDEAYTKRVEPGAWLPERRFDLMRQVKAAGHRVVLGLNPLVPEWCSDPAPLLEKAKAAGAEGVWIEPLHLSRGQVDGRMRDGKAIGGMSEKGKAAISLPIIDRVVQRKAHSADIDAYLAARKAADAMGLHVFSVGQSERSDFWRPYIETYGADVLFPTMQEFVNLCHDNAPDGAVITFDDFWSFFEPHLPDGKWPLSRYIKTKAHDIVAENRVPSSLTYREVFAMLWAEPRIAWCPARMRCFAYAGKRRDEKRWFQYTDHNDLPYLVFSRQPFDAYMVEADDFVTNIPGVANERAVEAAGMN